MRKILSEDLVFILIMVFLFLLAIVNFLAGAFAFMFTPSIVGASLFAFMCEMLLLYYFFIWGFIKVKNQFKGNRIGFKSVTRVLFSKVAHFIGLKTISPKDSLYFLLSMIIGMVFNFLVLIALLHFDHGTLLYVSSPSLYVLVQNLILPPILEELIFRGIYLSVFLKVLGKNYVSAVSGLVLSAFTFGWCPPTQAIVKTIAGFLLGFIYLFAWKKNIAASSLAHFGANLVGTFFIWVS